MELDCKLQIVMAYLKVYLCLRAYTEEVRVLKVQEVCDQTLQKFRSGNKEQNKILVVYFRTLLLIEIFLISQHTHTKTIKYGSYHFLCLFFPTTLLSRCLIIIFLLFFTFFSLFLCTITFFLAFLFFKLSIFTFF